MAKAGTTAEKAKDEAAEAQEQETVDAEPLAEEDVPADGAERGASEEQLGEMEQRALAVRESVTVSPQTMPSPREWEAMRAMAETVCMTEFVPRDFRNRPEAVLAAILAGRELGIGPMQSLKDISIIDGRPAIAAHLALAILRRKVKIVESESTDQRAWIKAQRTDTGEVAEVEWTMDEAVKAGLASKKNWQNYPADMLWARAVGRLGRRIGSDLLSGMPYTAEEVADFEDFDHGPADGGYVSGPIQTRREERVGQVPGPKSWAEMNDRLAEVYGGGTAADFGAFVHQTSALFFGTQETTELKRDQKDVLWQKACTAYLKLRETVERELPPPSRDEMRAAFAQATDGVELTGPEWRMGPDETDRPEREALAESTEVKE